MTKTALAIHGGCGVMAKQHLSEADWAAARVDLYRSLLAGWAVLQSGGSALDAVQAAVVVMEDSPHFNAGHGAALNTDGEHELDASIMDGRTLETGAVTLAKCIRNPVNAARRVMEKGDAVLLGGSAADDFARVEGINIVDQSYFRTDKRVNALAAMKAHASAGTVVEASESEKHGTVGAVALDAAGHLAAATSTGGYNNKPAGRIGDTPIAGAGTYARDGACAVSGTGKGEFFIRYAVGHEVASRIRYLDETVEQSSVKVIMEELGSHNIGAGLVAVGADGSIAAPYNTAGMFRGWVTTEGRFFVATHEEVYAL